MYPEAPHAITEMVIPLGKQRGEIAHLITARPNIPGFRDQLHFRQHRVLPNRLKQRRILPLPRRPSHHRTQIEAEAINMAFLHPKFQAADGKIHHTGMA